MFRYTTETPSGCGGHFVWWQQVIYINRSPPQKYVSEVENSTWKEFWRKTEDNMEYEKSVTKDDTPCVKLTFAMQL